MIVYSKDKSCNKALLGGKGYGLFKLAEYGFNVPDFFVIEPDTDVTEKNFVRQLDEYADRLGGDLFAVRSSGVSEDGDEASFAGQFSTELNVTKHNLLDAVCNVRVSAADSAAQSYADKLGKVSCGMAVVVQKMIAPLQSGVLFSCAPDESDTVLIERVDGSGDNLVSGKVVPQTLRFKKGVQADGYLGELLAIAEYLEQREGPVDVEWCFDGRLYLLQMRRQTVLSDVIPPVPDRDWNMYVYRDFAPFCHSVQIAASRAQIQRDEYGFSVPISEGLLVCGREFYSRQNDEDADAVWRQKDKGDFFDDFYRRVSASVCRTRRKTANIKNRDYSQLSNSALLKQFDRVMSCYTQSYVPMMMRPDDYLYGKLCNAVGTEACERYVKAAADLLPPTDYSSERKSFLLAVASNKAEQYVKKYEWKNNPLGKKLAPVTMEEFRLRASHLTSDEALALVRQGQRAHRKAAANARKQLQQADEKTRKTVELIRKFTYLRTRTAESSDRYFYYVRTNLLRTIAQRFNLTDETLALYTVEDVRKLFKGERLSLQTLTRRKSGEAIVFKGEDVKTYFGANAYALLSRLLPSSPQTNVIYGQIACRGEATGKVKKVTNFADSTQAQEGCILVASMTTPDLSLALQKAAGIITDEGGVTCHAAIIAREYAVPCLVGTKVATQKLRDGTLVKLDCVNGFFEILDGEKDAKN